MKAYSYKRISSKKQIEGGGIQRQTQLAEDYCNKYELQLSDLNFEDLGVSGYHSRNTEEDAALGRFIRGVEEGSIPTPCYLLVESLDRLSRARVQTALRQLLHIAENDVVIVTLMDEKKFDKSSDAMDIMYSLMIIQRAWEESEIKSQRVSAYWEQKRQDPFSKKKGGSRPFWILINEEGTEFSVNEPKADTVRRIFELKLTGMGTMAIARRMAEEGHKSGFDKQWSGGTIANVLRSRAVIGDYLHRDGSVADYYPPIVDKDTFNKVQVMLIGNNKPKGSTSSHRNIVKDIATCRCGDTFSLSTKKTPTGKNKGKKVAYYRCNNVICNNLYNDRTFEIWLKQYFCAPPFHNSWVDTSDHEDQRQRLITDKKLELNASQEALQAILSVPDGLSNPLILKKVSELSEQQRDLEEGLEELEKAQVVSNRQLSYQETRELIDTAFEDSNEPDNIKARTQLRQLLNACFSKIVFWREDGYFYLDVKSGDQEYNYKSVFIRRKILDPLWTIPSDKPLQEVEDKQAVIDQFRYNPDA
ncbi:recombinase family protein [Vibrio lentus]|uniref:recombinase family protein n=1 Tax=Vibrio lentus TaxID=136468 RepID=UPI00148535D5|nr:recombinase family protein [Vibrio lentus]